MTLPEPLPEQKRVQALEDHLGEIEGEIAETKLARQKAEARVKDAEIDAAEVRALVRMGEAKKKDAEAKRTAYEDARLEAEKLREEEADLLRTKAILEERLETTREEANQAAVEAHKALLADHVEKIADLLNELAPAMAAQKAACLAYRDALSKATGRSRTLPSLWIDEVLSHTGGSGAIGRTKLTNWFQRARQMGFDVQLEHGPWGKGGSHEQAA